MRLAQKCDARPNLRNLRTNLREVFMLYVSYEYTPFLPSADEHHRSMQKGFGDEDPSLQGLLEEYFKQFGAVSAVRMRRDENKKFKVSTVL